MCPSVYPIKLFTRNRINSVIQGGTFVIRNLKGRVSFSRFYGLGVDMSLKSQDRVSFSKIICLKRSDDIYLVEMYSQKMFGGRKQITV